MRNFFGFRRSAPEIDPIPLRPYTDLTGDERSALNDLQLDVVYPLRGPEVVHALYKVATQFWPRAGYYDAIVEEGASSHLPAEIYRQLVDEARARHDLPPVDVYDVDIARREEPIPIPPAPTSDSRALVVAEYVAYGGSVHYAYNATARERPPSTIDIAAVGSSRRPLDWTEPGTAYFRAPDTHRLDKYLTGAEVRARTDPERISESIGRVTSIFIDMLDETQPTP